MVANRLRDAAAVLEVDSAYRRDAAIMREAADEVDRLRHDIERHVEIACELATECERLRAELAEAKKPDCRLCEHFDDWDIDCVLRGTAAACVAGHNYLGVTPVRLYEIDAAMAGGENG